MCLLVSIPMIVVYSYMFVYIVMGVCLLVKHPLGIGYMVIYRILCYDDILLYDKVWL